jgi:mRNA interferase MazF
MTILPGGVVLVQLPVAVGPVKPRPGLVVAEFPGAHKDYLVTGISTQLRHYIPGWDEMMDQLQPDFASSGLRHPSIVRLSHLHNVAHPHVLGQLGLIGTPRLERLINRLIEHLRPSAGIPYS